MNGSPLKVLLVEDNPADVRLIQEMLAGNGDFSYELESADRLSTAFEHLKESEIGVVLLDLSLPDAHGFEGFEKVKAFVPDIPIVILTGLDDQDRAVQAVQSGAQDFLVKGELSESLLFRALQYAVERHRLTAELRNLSLVDELTGLYNRRGFFTHGEQHLKAIQRTKGVTLLVYVDLDGMKEVNDTYGHQEGDSALRGAAEVLNKTFRQSDIIARMGGDEFTILASPIAIESAEIISSRLEENLKEINSKKERPYELSLSLGIGDFPYDSELSLEEMVTSVDKEMYRDKERKR